MPGSMVDSAAVCNARERPSGESSHGHDDGVLVRVVRIERGRHHDGRLRRPRPHPHHHRRVACRELAHARAHPAELPTSAGRAPGNGSSTDPDRHRGRGRRPRWGGPASRLRSGRAACGTPDTCGRDRQHARPMRRRDRRPRGRPVASRWRGRGRSALGHLESTNVGSRHVVRRHAARPPTPWPDRRDGRTRSRSARRNATPSRALRAGALALRQRTERDGSGAQVDLGALEVADGGDCLVREPGRQHRAVGVLIVQCREDRHQLGRRLAGAVHHFGVPGPLRAVEIHAGEAQVRGPVVLLVHRVNLTVPLGATACEVVRWTWRPGRSRRRRRRAPSRRW